VHDLRLVAAALAAPLVATAALTIGALRGLPQQPAERVASLRLRGPLGVLLVSRGLINVGFFTLLGFLLFFVRDSLGVRGADAVKMQTALLFLSFTVSAIGGAIAAAHPADRYDKRLVVSLAVGVIAIALAFLAGAQNLAVAYGGAALAGAAWGAFVTTDWALASILLPGGAMATAMGIWNVATAVPQIVAPLVTAPLVERVNAMSAGLGPRLAIVLALVEFVAGGTLIWRLPRA
jgi:MFS family permease